jgi:SAM-dependent methyltransferase
MNTLYHPGLDKIYQPNIPIQHREEDYPEDSFELLWKMQERHFWYRGRHRFLLHSLDRALVTAKPMSAIDLGGGVGGWIRYLADRRPAQYSELALGDSSLTALRRAGGVLPQSVQRYQIDLMNLGWQDQWDVAFLLDVIEHLPDDVQAMRQATAALKPGGFLFVTTPAFPQFWSYNDDLAHHLRRYRKPDFQRLAKETGLVMKDARYFMFFLSPLYLLSRFKPNFNKLSLLEQKMQVSKQHAVPAAPLNAALTVAFGAETPLGHWMPFPWGTSILGVFQKP